RVAKDAVRNDDAVVEILKRVRPLLLLSIGLLACQAGSNAKRTDSSSPGATSVAASIDSGDVAVRGPTLIAFSPALTQAQLDSSEDLSTVLDAFPYHLSTASDSVRKLGFVVVARPHGSIRLLNGTSSRDVTPAPDSANVGYIFAAPNRQDRLM